jgi:hypothetical protein
MCLMIKPIRASVFLALASTPLSGHSPLGRITMP